MLVLHIKTTCKSFEKRRECILGDRCTMGHDYPKVRLSLIKWREREAARNRVFNSGCTEQMEGDFEFPFYGFATEKIPARSSSRSREKSDASSFKRIRDWKNERKVYNGEVKE